MTGRGRRLGGYGEKGISLRRPGEVGIFPQCDSDISTQSLIKSINELSLTNFDPIALHETEITFRKLCTTGDMVRDVLMNLHCKALSDSLFGEKLLLILEQVASLEVDNVCVRSELLNFIENDFKMKDTLFQSDSQKFLNAVLFHGRVYNIIKIQGVPIKVLGAALLEYMDLLMNGSEKQLRVLVIQILLNGPSISKTDSLVEKYESLKCSLRKTLVEKNLNRDSMFYILLALDYLSNNLQPLSGVVRNFYVENMGEDFLALEYLIKDSHLSQNSEIQLTNKVMRNKNIFHVNDSSYESKEILKKVEDLSVSQDVGRSFSHSHDIMTSDSFKNESGKFGLRNRKLDGKKQMDRRNDFKKNTDLMENQIDDENEEFYGIQLKSNRIGTRKLMNRNFREKEYSENKAKFHSAEMKLQSENVLSVDEIESSEPVWE